ncbi:MAG TPA: FkbM family methyltransferase, partial [Mycobacteriales bacterium]|nr:FkbM family methyltransferase [Mycobacteriales bacterium]
FEPDPSNLGRLRQTVAEHASRVEIVQAAVTADEVSCVPFTFMGRYGHETRPGEPPGVEVPAIPVANLLRGVAADAGRIDLVKIDTEGSEAELVAAIPGELEIGAVVYEDRQGFTRWVYP